MREQLSGFSAVKLPLKGLTTAWAEKLKKFGPVSEFSLAGIKDVISFLGPVKSFTTRYAGVEVGNWSYLLSDMRGENCYVDAYALSRATGCGAIGVTVLSCRRELQVIESGNIVREVQSLEDGDRWYFRESGEVQSFEDPSEYSKPRKRDRLSVEALGKYFECFTGQKLPHWETLESNPAIGLQRSTKDHRGAIIAFETSCDL